MTSPIATLFRDVYCSSNEVVGGVWAELFERLKNVDSYTNKRSAPLIKLAKFGDTLSKNKSLRHDANLIEILGVEGDYDGEVMAIEDARGCLEKHGIRAILYSTWSSTSDKPRWRVLTPLSKPYSKDFHERFVARLNGVLGGVLAKESFTLSQGYFIGKNPDKPYTCICTYDDPTHGECIDQCDQLDQIAYGKNAFNPNANRCDDSSGTFENWLADLLEGEDLHNNALRVVGRMVAQGLEDALIKSIFSTWRNKLAEARGDARAGELLGDELARMINGARSKGFAAKNIDQVLDELRLMPSEELRKKWIDLVVPLHAIDRATALHEMQRLTGIGIQPLKQELSSKEKEIERLKKINATSARVGERENIFFQAENIAAMADRAEALTVKGSSAFELARFGGQLVRVIVQELPLAHYADSDLPPSPTAQTDIMIKPKLLPLVERAVVFQSQKESGDITNIGVPDKILDHIIANPKTVPNISAMITHPVVTIHGRIISATGIDKDTGLLLFENQTTDNLIPYSKVEAKAAIKRLKSTFLEGFEFASNLDRTAAMAILFTAIERKLMPDAPGGLVSAAQQSTGKTTLVKKTHIILTGRDLPVMCWPEGNETEIQKMLLSTLMRSPELICFDNVGDGLTFRSPTLALAMTSPLYEGRILGLSRDASVPTNVMMTVTGNNLNLANDEVHRWIRVNLTSTNPAPHKRKFNNQNVLKHGLAIREEVLRDCIGIIAGYSRQRKRIAPGSRFSVWDSLVRQPLIWTGEQDVGRVFDLNMEQSEEIGARMALLKTLHSLFNGKEFRVRDIIDCCYNAETCDASASAYGTIKEALKALHVKDLKNELSVGHGLGKLIGIPVLISDEKPTVTLETTSRLVGGLKRYRVEIFKPL